MQDFSGEDMHKVGLFSFKIVPTECCLPMTKNTQKTKQKCGSKLAILL